MVPRMLHHGVSCDTHRLLGLVVKASAANLGSIPAFAVDFYPSFSFSFSSRQHRSAQKCPYALRSVSQQSPQGCPRNSVNICLVEHRSFSTLEGRMSAASFLGLLSRSIHTGELKIDTQVANLPGTWRYRVGAGTGLPAVNIA